MLEPMLELMSKKSHDVGAFVGANVGAVVKRLFEEGAVEYINDFSEALDPNSCLPKVFIH